MPTADHPSRRAGLRAAVATAVAVPLLSSTLTSAAARAADRAGDRLETMTFNLRFASDSRPNSWEERRPAMRALLRQEHPHVIGTQEGLYHQLQDIATDLGAAYDWIGTGRAGGSRDEFMAVFFDTDRLTSLEYDHFWLSDTPNVIASNTWGGNSIRMVTWVRFRDLGAGGEFYVLNTHLDDASQNARARAATLIAERIRGLDRSLPLVVTGDFNVAAHKNPVYDTMLGAGLVDSWDAAAERSKQYGTYHGYRPLVLDGARIDWILTTSGVTVQSAVINTFSLDGQFPSDHLPVQASLGLG